MPDTAARALVVFAGAAITIGSSMIAGLRLHRFMQKHAPQLAPWVPKDGAVLAGFAVGAVIVAMWLT